MSQRIQIPDIFRPLTKPSRYKGAFGGRGSGKSHFFATAIVLAALQRPRLRVLCVREVQKSLKESAKRLIEDKIEDLGVADRFDALTTEIKCPGKGVISFAGMQDHTADSIKSYEGYDIAWGEEAHTLSSRSLELLRPTIRSPGSELWFSWNPRAASDPVDALFRSSGALPTQRDDGTEFAISVKANYCDNPFFPNELEEERAYDEQFNRDRYAHIWLGEYEPMAVGAIWDRQTIERNRREAVLDVERIVVGVDPAVSSEDGSNEHGIVVCGLGGDGRGYVLDDVSCQGTPKQWATRTIAAFDRWEADAIVIEINQGGDMVKHTLESIRPDLNVIEVRATRGKHVRAEPISSLYALDRISHIGTFQTLEDQMCLMTAAGYEGEGSPDHVDAMVWAFTELFPSLTTPTPKQDSESHRPARRGGWMGG